MEGQQSRDHTGRFLTQPGSLSPFLLQEKIRPIDKKLHYQVEKLLAAAQAAGTAGAQVAPAAEGAAAAAAEDPLRYGPRPDALVAKVQLPGACPEDAEHVPYAMVVMLGRSRHTLLGQGIGKGGCQK